jgi:lipoprotein NlpI
VRGDARFEHGDFEAAQRDFARAYDLGSRDAYTVLFLAVTEMRLASGDWVARLDARSKGFREDWPMPIIQFYRGALTADQLMLAARGSDKSTRRLRTCTAQFFLGEWQLGHGQRREAIGSLRKAESKCTRSNNCYWGALGELKNLGTGEGASNR